MFFYLSGHLNTTTMSTKLDLCFVGKPFFYNDHALGLRSFHSNYGLFGF